MKIGVGMVGAGLMGAVHSFMLKKIASFSDIDLELVAIADMDKSKLAGFAAGFGYKETYADYKRITSHPDVNVIYITTPTVYHKEILKESVSKGKHVFCEKPLAFTAQEAQDMLDSTLKAGVKHQVGLVLRYSPTFNVIKDFLSNDLGFPMTVLFRDDQVFPIKGVHNTPWRGDVKSAGGGTIIEHSIHDVDMLTWLFGPIMRLEAKLDNLAGVNGIEDRAVVWFEFESGMTATLVSLWHDVLKRESCRLIEIFFERAYLATDEDFLGTVKVQLGDNILKTISRDDVFTCYIDKAGINRMHADELGRVPYGFEDLAFIKAIIEGRQPEPGLEVAVAAHKIIDAIYESANKRSPIYLNEKDL